MALIEVRGRRLEVERIGSGGSVSPRAPVLVFLHEGLGCAATWRDFPRDLAAATGRPALVYSRFGYGASDPAELPRPTTFMHEEARVVLPELLERAGVDDAILIGHSDGGSIALLYAAAHGRRVRGLALEAPHVFVEDICTASIAALRGGYPGSEMAEKLARRHADADATFYGWTDVWLRPDFRRWNIEEHLASVRAPVLVIQGEDDEYGTTAQVDAVCAKVGGLSSRLILPGVGHAPHRDAPEVVLEAMATFVGRIMRAA
jgi:pimeloyl-ACP methyl ester carboxylesterase